VLQAVQRKVSPSMNQFLLKTFKGEEVEEALAGNGDLKAPGPLVLMGSLLSSTSDFGDLWATVLRMRCWLY
jgi:hypothetical protein